MKKNVWTSIIVCLLIVFMIVATAELGYILHLQLSDDGETTAKGTESYTESISGTESDLPEASGSESASESENASGGISTSDSESVTADESETTDATETTGKTETTVDTETTVATESVDTTETTEDKPADTTETTSETEESESEENIPVEPEINYGSLNNPVTTTYAYNVCAGLADGESSLKPFYVQGEVTKIGKAGDYYEKVYFTDGKTEMLIYTINMGTGITGFEVGDTITAYGYIKNYQGIIEMASYGPRDNQIYVYVVDVISDEADQGGSGGSQGGTTTQHTYTEFTSAEKSTFNSVVGMVIPFIPNDDYVVKKEEDDGEEWVSFYTFGNTQAEFDAYRTLFGDYTFDGTEEDEYGDTWYLYSKGDVCVDMSFYYYDGAYVVDIYVYISSEGSGDTGDDDYTGGDDYVDGSEINYGTIGNPVTTTYAYNACSSLGKNEFSAYPFYVQGTVTKITSVKNNSSGNEYYENVYFTDGKTNLLIYTINMSNGITGFEVGDTIIACGYIKNYNGTTIEMASYGPKGDQIYVYVVKIVGDSGNQGGSSGGSRYDDSVLTNDGKGLPQEQDGIYDVDFTKGTPVKNVTEQGYYLDGCPTMGNVPVLVIPVEFSDITATSKGYTIENIEKIFNGSKNELSYYSVDEYFAISSYGGLDLDVTVVDSWFRPDNNSSYYENYYEDGMLMGDQLILDEALEYLANIMDLSEFDSDENGVIDAVIMINTLEIGEDDFHWAYRYWNYYADDEGYYYEYDGVSANDYVWAAYEFMFEGYEEGDDEANYDTSNPLNPYTFIHEFSHVLGADDYYDTEYVENPLDGCDIMDAMTGDHNPYTKFNLGWITESQLIVTDSSVTVELEAFAKNGDTVIFANNWDDKLGAYQEYYIVMYYTATGLNAADAGYFARDGVIVYHVNSVLYFDEEYDCYDVYNNNTSASGEYGTEDNLIELVRSEEGNYTYVGGDSLPAITDDFGNDVIYTFTVDSITEDCATITFTKN